MDTPLRELLDPFHNLLAVAALSSVRLGVMFVVFPPLTGDVLGGVVRAGVVLSWSFLIAVGQSNTMADIAGGLLAVLMLKEALIGLVMSYAASSVFWVAQSAGSYIDELAGYNNVQRSNPSYGEQTSIVGTLLGQCAIVAFWALGGMTVLLGTLYDSYRWWPLASLAPTSGLLLEAFVLRQTDTLMQSITKLAMPFMLLLAMIDLAVGFAARVAAKLELEILGQPLKGALCLLALALMLGSFLDQVKSDLTLGTLSAEVHALLFVGKDDMAPGGRHGSSHP